MLYEPAVQNYRTSSRLIGAHSAKVVKSPGEPPAPRLTREQIHATRSVPQFTLVNSTGLGTTQSKDVLVCQQRGAITQEMVRSHWNTKQIENAKFDGVSENKLLPKSGTKPQNTPITPAMKAQLAQDQFAGVSTAFLDPIQRQQHHPFLDNSIKVEKPYETSTQRATPQYDAAARQRVQPSLTFKTHNPAKISENYKTEKVPITDTLASHFSIAHHSTPPPAGSSTSSSISSSSTSSSHIAPLSYETTTGSQHRDPSQRTNLSRSAGTTAKHQQNYDIVFHRQRINPAHMPWEHPSKDVSVRRYIPKSTQDSYNIVTGQSIP